MSILPLRSHESRACGSWYQALTLKPRLIAVRLHILSLSPLNSAKLVPQAVDTFLQATGFFGYLALSGWRLSSWFTFDHNIKVDEFMGDRGHVVFEAERVFPNVLRSEDVVPLTFPLPVKHDATV